MGQQRGTYYWDDDSLSPGNRSEGGWSENLFDDDGKLRGHARFIPDPDSDDDGYTYSPYDDPPMFMSSETRRESEDEDNSPIIDLLAEVLAQAVVQLIEDAAAAGFGGVWVFRTVCFERVVLSSPGCLWPGRMDDHEEVLEAHA